MISAADAASNLWLGFTLAVGLLGLPTFLYGVGILIIRALDAGWEETKPESDFSADE